MISKCLLVEATTTQWDKKYLTLWIQNPHAGAKKKNPLIFQWFGIYKLFVRSKNWKKRRNGQFLNFLIVPECIASYCNMPKLAGKDARTSTTKLWFPCFLWNLQNIHHFLAKVCKTSCNCCQIAQNDRHTSYYLTKNPLNFASYGFCIAGVKFLLRNCFQIDTMMLT